MRKTFLLIIATFLLSTTVSWGQTTINFDDEAAWTQDAGVSSLTSYGNHSYSEQGVTVEGTNILRNSTTSQDGFDGALGTYSIRIRNVANAKIIITIANGGVSNFSFDIRRWDGSPIPDYTVRYSTNDGADWTNLPNIDGSILTTSNWFNYNGSINNENNNIKIEIANTGSTERIMVDNFTWSAFSSAPVPTISVSASNLTGFAYDLDNGPSVSQSIELAGVNLTNDIVITPPFDFEISLDNSAFQSTAITLAQTGGNVASTTIYARMKAGLAGGTYNQNIVITSTGAMNKTIACSGKIMDLSLPFIENFTADLGFFTPVSESGTQAWYWASFNDETYAYMNGYSGGSNANVDWLISPTFNFTNYTNLVLNFREAINYFTSYQDVQVLVSTNYNGNSPASSTWTALTVTGRAAGTSWEFADVNPVSLSDYEGVAAVTIAFKYISNSSASSGWEISKVAITGEKSAAVEPSNHVTNFAAVAATVTETTIDLAWDENDGTNLAAGYLIKASTTTVVPPVNGTDPANDTNLTDGSGNVKVPHGTNTYQFDNCLPGTTYHFSIYPYAGSGAQIVYKTDGAPSTQASTPVQLFAPIIAPTAGFYDTAVEISMTSATLGAAIYYTTDGSQPDGSSMLYSAPFTIETSATIKAVAMIDQRFSTVVEAAFEVEIPGVVNVVRPVIAPVSGTYYDIVDVTITCETEGAVIYYTTDGTAPNTNSTRYEGMFSIDASKQIKAIAYVGTDFSTVATVNYTVITLPDVVAQPVVLPADGVYISSVEVSITCETVGAIIYYTTDGSVPGANSLTYQAPFTLTETTWVRAIAVFGPKVSEIGQGYFDIASPVSEPVISPATGNYTDQVEITITTETTGAEIYYTTDGYVPSTESTLYDGPFTITESVWITAIAVLGSFQSDMVTAYYEITVAPAPIEVSTLAELRAGETDGRIYQFTGNAVLTFAMTFRGQKYIQDETAGILIDDNSGKISTSFVIGEGISGITGSLSDYNGLLQFLPNGDAAKVNDPGFTIEPQTISISEFKNNFENYESELIVLNDCTFEETGNFANGTNYTITSNGESTILRTHFYNVDYIGNAIPAKKNHITGIALWHFDEAKIVPRTSSDFEEATNVAELGILSKIYGINKSIAIENIDEKVSHITVYQMDGRIVKTVKAQSNRHTIAMEKPGLYLVVLNNNNLTVQTAKVIVQ